MPRRIYPGEAVLVAVILAIVPFLFVRGPANRIARRLLNRAEEQKSEYSAATDRAVFPEHTK